jgi:hypothetical protein
MLTTIAYLAVALFFFLGSILCGVIAPVMVLAPFFASSPDWSMLALGLWSGLLACLLQARGEAWRAAWIS